MRQKLAPVFSILNNSISACFVQIWHVYRVDLGKKMGFSHIWHLKEWARKKKSLAVEMAVNFSQGYIIKFSELLRNLFVSACSCSSVILQEDL